MTGSLRNTFAVALAVLASLWPARYLFGPDFPNATLEPTWLAQAAGIVVGLQVIAALTRLVTRQAIMAQLSQVVVLGIGAAIWWGTHAATLASDWRWGACMGAVALITVLTDALFIALRSAMLASLVMLTGYTVASIAYSQPQDPTSIIGVGIAVVILLASRSMDHAARWPRGGDAEGVRPVPLAVVALIAGTIATVVAMITSTWVPVRSEPLITLPEKTTVHLHNPLIELDENLLRPDNYDVLTYSTSSGEPTYLRISTLAVMTTQAWTQSDMSLTRASTASVPGYAGPRTTESTSVVIEHFESDYLPVPYAPTRWKVPGTWSVDPVTLTILNTDADGPASPLSYTVDSVVASPDDPATLQAGDPQDEGLTLELPADLPPLIAQTAAEVTADAASDGEKAVALQAWLSDPEQFHYTLDAPHATGTDTMTAFLESRSGYCIHYAATMATMARTLGIPSRLAVGFTSGTRQDDGRYLVTAHNMHAWTELYFDQWGWVAFDPTVTSGEDGQDSQDPSPDAEDQTPPDDTQQTTPDTTEITVPAPVPTRSPIGMGLPWLALAALIVAAPALVRLIQSRRRLAARAGREGVEALWTEVGATAVDSGGDWPLGTPRHSAQALDLPESARPAMQRLALAVEKARYAAHEPAMDGLHDDARTVIAALKQSRSRWARVSAVVWPPSVFRRLR